MSKKNRLVNADVLKMTDEELTVEIAAQRSKHFVLRSQSVTEKVEDHSQYSELKKNVARLMTEQSVRRKAKASSK